MFLHRNSYRLLPSAWPEVPELQKAPPKGLASELKQIIHSDNVSVIIAMIDSGSAGNFIDYVTIVKLKLLQHSLNNPPRIRMMRGEID